MRMTVDLIESGADGIWSPDTQGIKLSHFTIERARRRAEARLYELAKWEDISGEWRASVRLDDEPIAEIEL